MAPEDFRIASSVVRLQRQRTRLLAAAVHLSLVEVESAAAQGWRRSLHYNAGCNGISARSEYALVATFVLRLHRLR